MLQQREKSGRPDGVFSHTRFDSFTHRCGEHTYTLIHIWALSAASATVWQSNVGIKGESHQSRLGRLLLGTFTFNLFCVFNEATVNVMEKVNFHCTHLKVLWFDTSGFM